MKVAPRQPAIKAEEAKGGAGRPFAEARVVMRKR